MEDCPICQLIKEGKILKEESGCCLLEWQDEPILDKVAPKRKIVICKSHEKLSLSIYWGQIRNLFQFDPSKGVITTFDKYAGHEGVILVPSSNVSQGKSGASNEPIG